MFELVILPMGSNPGRWWVCGLKIHC